jgi:hypothetical protein
MGNKQYGGISLSIYLKGTSLNRLFSFKLLRRILLISFLGQLLPLSAQKVTISGFITDNASKETLIGANIYDSITLCGTTTNNKGFFSMTLERGYTTIVTSYVGYESKSSRLFLRKDTSVIFSLNAGISLNQVNVVSLKNQTDFSKGRLTLTMTKLKELPALLGETDMIKALITLPGISQGNEGSSGMIVRGGSSDQNLYILDGIQVYNTGHLFNFISVFNPETIKRIDFYKSSFPSKYGGRLSSVTDITFRDGNSNHFKGFFDIGLINSKLTLEGPITNKTTFLFAARSTYFDLFTPFRRARIRNKQKFRSLSETVNDEMVLYTFADLNFKVTHRINSKNSISLNFYSGIDYYRIFNKYELQNESNKYTLLNNVSSIKSTHILGPKLFAATMVGFASNSGISKLENTLYHKYMIMDPSTKWISYSTVFERRDKSMQRSFVRDFSSAIDFSYYLSNSFTLNFGISAIKHSYQPGTYAIEETDTILNIKPLITRFWNKESGSIEGSTYLEEEVNLGDKIRITGGGRVNLFKSNNEFLSSIDPRLSVSAITNNSESFTVTYSRMTQSNHALIRNDLLMYKTVWVPAIYGSPPEKSDQVSLGFNKKYEEKGYSIQMEAFYKTMRNLVEYKINYLTQYAFYEWEKSLIINGRGQAYGIELSGEKANGIFTGNFNYTLSWYNRKFDELNAGKWFPFLFDRRHILNITGAVKINDAWKLSFLWTISSGHRINLPVAYINSNPYAYGYFSYDGLNTRRLPVYHRLDLGAEWQKKGKNGEPFGFRFSLFNAYNRLNAYYLYLDHTNQYDNSGHIIGSHTSVKKKTFLPAIPSINFFYRF